MIYAPLIGLALLWLVAAIGLLGQALLYRQSKELFARSQRRASWLMQVFLLVCSFVLALYLPSLVEMAHGFPVHEHTTHGFLHHSYHPAAGSMFWVLLVLSGGAFSLFLWATCVPLFRWFRLHQQLRKLEDVVQQTQLSSEEQAKLTMVRREWSPERNCMVVPGAWVGLVGLWRPTLLLGRELLAALDVRELQAILAHEEAHYQRKDSLWRFAFFVVSRFFPWWGPKWFREWTTDTEVLCDAQASETLGEPTLLAATLVKVRRIQFQEKGHLGNPTVSPSLLLGFLEDSNLEIRVHALLHGTVALQSPVHSRVSLALIACLSLLFVWEHQLLHHAIEHLFTGFFHQLLH
ncbi:MAG: hypothetical protein EP343_33360 [Deltaproteobacteria bacterium]|nr:MAG: hypothetical protein EP343_33360 [Deltaproteobacteria bacterium]